MHSDREGDVRERNVFLERNLRDCANRLEMMANHHEEHGKPDGDADYGPRLWRRTAGEIRRALAALDTPQEPPDPVAWRYKFHDEDEWHVRREKESLPAVLLYPPEDPVPNYYQGVIEPLYRHPPTDTGEDG